MRRYRWLKAKWPISICELADRLRSKSFEIDGTEGFVIDRIRDDYLQARFIEKIEFDSRVIDPFGGQSQYHHVEYRSCEFVAALYGAGLELVNAPRSVQTMISRLSEATDFSLSISPLCVDVLAWVSAIQENINLGGFVESVQISEMELDRGVQAKVVIKGVADVVETANELVAGRKHVVEKVKIRFFGFKQLTALLTNVGAASFEREPPDELVAIIRSTMLRQG